MKEVTDFRGSLYKELVAMSNLHVMGRENKSFLIIKSEEMNHCPTQRQTAKETDTHKETETEQTKRQTYEEGIRM